MSEDANGALWIGGTFDDIFDDGWAARINKDTGAVEVAGIRSYGVHPTNTVLRNAIRADRLVTVGTISENDSKQPAIGELNFDGTWHAVWRLGGLTDPIVDGGLVSGTALPNRELVLVGETRKGTSGCEPPCSGTDGLVVKLRSDRSIEWARAIGSSARDEMFSRVIRLPDGDIIAFGRGDGPEPVLVVRMTSSGNLVWARWLQISTSENNNLFDGVYDPRFDGVVLVGAMDDFIGIPVIVYLRGDGTVLRIDRVGTHSGEIGCVSAVALADDGGLFIAGVRTTVLGGLQHTYVAKLSTSRDAVEWTFETPEYIANNPWRHCDAQLLPLEQGELIVRAGRIMRLDPLGTPGDDCVGLGPAVGLGVTPVADMSISAPSIVVTDLSGGTTEPRTGHVTSFGNPSYPIACAK